MLAGITGVPIGSLLAQHLRPNTPNCDPIICAVGLLISGPLVYCAIATTGFSLSSTLIIIFFAEVTLNLSWSLVADILLVRIKGHFNLQLRLTFSTNLFLSRK